MLCLGLDEWQLEFATYAGGCLTIGDEEGHQDVFSNQALNTLFNYCMPAAFTLEVLGYYAFNQALQCTIRATRF